jgi:energy-converting hydrogenase Eha subunit C
MKGSIRMGFGTLCIFGAVGVIETTRTVDGIAPILWLAVGVVCVFSAIKERLV